MSDRAAAVTAATDLFWRKGFDEVSVADLVAATGMNRYALYSTFGSKIDLFLAALEHYYEEGRAQFEPLLRDASTPPLERIRICLNVFAQEMRMQKNGCLICHVAVEQRTDHPRIAAAVASYFEKIRGFIEIPLEQARAAGDLNPALPPALAAQLVFDAEMSMGVHARAGGDPGALDRIIAATMAALRAPQAPPPT